MYYPSSFPSNELLGENLPMQLLQENWGVEAVWTTPN